MKIKKIALCLGAGALCAATGGLAAPAIGAAIGGTMGLAGAAATSAGLAALGGGALAAGGAGMAGGVAVVQAVAGGVGVLGAGAIANAKEKADSKKDLINDIQKETDARVQREIKEEQEAKAAQAAALEEAKDFFQSAIGSLDIGCFLDLRDKLVPFYITIPGRSKEEIMTADLPEAVCEYFTATASKEYKNINKLIAEYYENFESIIESRIQKPAPVKRGEQPNPPCRAMRYFEKAKEYKNDSYNDHIIDYSRIMLCLYAGIIKNNFIPISNFDYSVDCIDPDSIISAMKKETNSAKKNGQLNRFAPGITHSSDACTFMLALIMMYKIKNDNI